MYILDLIVNFSMKVLQSPMQLKSLDALCANKHDVTVTSVIDFDRVNITDRNSKFIVCVRYVLLRLHRVDHDGTCKFLYSRVLYCFYYVSEKNQEACVLGV